MKPVYEREGKIFAVPKEVKGIYKKCRTCLWAETFVPRSDEKFSAGCTHKNWAGYVTLDGEMPCGGLAWAAKMKGGNDETVCVCRCA